MKVQSYILEKRNQTALILNALSKEFKIEKNSADKEIRYYYDSFDWRLFHENLILYYTNNRFVLCNMMSDTTISTAHFDKFPLYLYNKDLPSSPLKNRLIPIIDIRALIRQLSEEYSFQTIYLLNEDDKKVVRLFFQNSSLLSDQKKTHLNQSLQVNAIRGYLAAENKVHEIIQRFSSKSDSFSHFQRIIYHSGNKPAQYSSKIKINLQENMTIGEALQKILAQFADVIKRNEAGIRDDIDIEFLHDFRVAVRRTRSLMGQSKEILPTHELALFRAKFADLQKATNELRDLDVYLLKEQSYKKILPASLKKPLDLLFDELHEVRINEQQQVKKKLNSKDYKLFLKEWFNFLKSKQVLLTPEAQTPVLPFAKKVIRKRLQNVLLKMNEMNNINPGDPQIHAMRIESKKLRYLLEFFSSLFPVPEIKRVVDQLKNVQDLLGTYNDLSVQSLDLEQRLSRLNFEQKNPMKTAAAYGGLLTYFNQERKMLKKQFKEAFRLFQDPDQLEIYQKLFNRNF